jgi:thioredoxin reductase (NADPH)
VRSIHGDDVVTAIALDDSTDDPPRTLPVDGVFVVVGGAPMTAIVRQAGIAVDARGCIQVDRRQVTNVAGVYAAGDCTCGGMQIVTAVGEGAMAAMQAYRYVRTVKP